MFTLLACADLYGEKVNLEIPFPSVPTINELTRTIEQVYDAESQHLRPQGYPIVEVKVSRIQVYDDTFLKWVDLISSTQLHEYDQLYVFQPQSPWHVDLQKDLPAPRPPSGPMPQYSAGAPPPPQHAASASPAAAHGAGYAPPPPPHPTSAAPYAPYAPPPGGSPAPRAAPAPGACAQPVAAALAMRERQNIPREQKVQTVFRELDVQQKGWIDVTGFGEGFRGRGIDFSTNTVQELFNKGDANRDGRIDWNEWVAWCDLYPNTLEVVYYRGRDTFDDEQIRQEREGVNDAVERNRARDADLRRQLDECQRQAAELQQQLAGNDQRGTDAAQRRHLLEQQERDLLEQEIKLERQKDQLRLSQHRFQEVAAAFDTGAAGHGSPRRADGRQVHTFR